VKWHVFFDRDYRPHNHSTQYALALWAMGADDEILRAAYYDFEVKHQIPIFKSPERITTKNFNEHLGDDEYYIAYLEYYTEIVRSKGVVAPLEEHIFDLKANFIAGKNADEQPRMLDRFLDGIMHSFIHTGNGLEFGLPGLVAEGLAWTAVHLSSSPAVIPSSLWDSSAPGTVESLTSRFLGLGKTAPETQGNTHALTILARILKDPQFDALPEADRYDQVYFNAESKYGDAIAEHVRAWSFDRMDPKEVERKIEELVWAAAVIYTIGGWNKGENFNSDFFSVHFITSSLFLSPVAAVLKPVSQELLLRSYFAVCLTWWIGRGRQGFDIPAFYAEASATPAPLYPHPTPHKDALPSADSPKAISPNAWFPLIQQSLVIPDDHFPKALRALAHYGEVYGRRAPGQADFASTELPFADRLDGSLFIRAAVLTNEKLGREKDVDVSDTRYWDRKGLEVFSTLLQQSAGN